VETRNEGSLRQWEKREVDVVSADGLQRQIENAINALLLMVMPPGLTARCRPQLETNGHEKRRPPLQPLTRPRLTAELVETFARGVLPATDLGSIDPELLAQSVELGSVAFIEGLLFETVS
jgi:hypothetical protein